MDSVDTSEPKKTLAQRAMTAALIITGAGILVNLVFYVTGMDMEMLTNPAINWLNRILLIGITYYFIHVALRSHRDEDLGGYVSVGQGIGLGTLTGLISGVLSAVWFYIFTTFIATDMMDKIQEVTIQQMQEQGGQSEEQAEEALEMMSFFFSPVFFAIVVVISSIFFGFLCGLVAGLVLKKDKPSHI
ncbi:MAG: DUF4199 domain-containing protein [Saprospiraceae bacterium]